MQVNMHTDFDNKEVADLIQEKTVDTVSAKVQTGDNPQVAVIKTPPVDETVKTEIFNALKTSIIFQMMIYFQYHLHQQVSVTKFKEKLCFTHCLL